MTMAEKWIHEDGPRVGYETLTRPGRATADKLNSLPLPILQDYVRPLRPGEKANQREEPDVSDTYRRGGAIRTAPRVRRYADGGTINHFDTGGQQPFGYDPSAYVSWAGKQGQGLVDRGDAEYQWGQDQFNKNEGTANQVIGTSLRNAGLFDDAARAGLSRYQTMYGPAMQQHLDFARNFASPAQLEAARARGIANVGEAYDRQTLAAADALRGEGLDPKALGARLDSSIRTKRAADSVAAGNTDVLNREIAGQTMLGQSIGLGQADANLTNQFAGMGMANRNQAINTGLATTQSGAATKAASLPYSTAGMAEMKEWPKAELDAMHASNEQGALWNDINRTGLQGLQIANQSGSGAGALAGGIFGGLSSMFKFSPITLSHGGVIPHAAGGGTLALGSNWRKFAYTNPVGNPEAIDVETPEIKKSKPAQYGSQPFEFDLSQVLGGGASSPTEAMPPTSGQIPTEATDAGSWGGSTTYPMVPTDAGTWGGVYERGGRVKKFYNAGNVPSTTDDVEKFSRKMTAMDPSGYAGFASDAFALGRDLFDPSAQDATQKPGDPWGLTGPYEVSQSQRVGGDIGRPVGRAVGAFFGAPGPGAAAGEALGGVGGAIAEGNIGKGFENLGRSALAMGESGVMQGMKGLGGMGGGRGDGTIMNLVKGLGGGGAGDPGAGTGGSEVTDAGGWGVGDMGGGDMGIGDMGFAVARGGQIPMGPLGRLAHFVNGGSPEDLQAPVSRQPGAIQTGDTVPASAQVPGIEGPDNVPAMVAAGEGILPQRFMKWRGEQWLQKEIAKADKEMQKPQVAGPEEGPTPQAAIQTGPTFASEGAMT
jgi:hypothetical protein